MTRDIERASFCAVRLDEMYCLVAIWRRHAGSLKAGVLARMVSEKVEIGDASVDEDPKIGAVVRVRKDERSKGAFAHAREAIDEFHRIVNRRATVKIVNMHLLRMAYSVPPVHAVHRLLVHVHARPGGVGPA
jgi:hypothetical protein